MTLPETGQNISQPSESDQQPSVSRRGRVVRKIVGATGGGLGVALIGGVVAGIPGVVIGGVLGAFGGSFAR